jgi:hypothetical protein
MNAMTSEIASAITSTIDENIGTILVNRYRVLGKIGSGATGQVYKVSDEIENKMYTLFNSECTYY